MKKFIYSLLLLYFCFESITYSQGWCGTVLNLEQIQKTDTALYAKILASEKHTREYIEALENQALTSGPGPDDIITIPVVVHVVWNINHPEQNINDAQINSQIAVLNADYRRFNADASNTPAEFLPMAADCKIEFRLTTHDPNGVSTTGIIRKSTQTTEFNYGDDGVKRNSMGGDDPWDVTRYLNIYVCNLVSFRGYGTWPNPLPPYIDGLVVRYTCFGTNGTATYPHNQGRISTHELGHCLIYIIFGDT